jgi:large-conductance mechanosensitive channel
VKYAKPIALVLGVLIIGGIVTAFAVSHIRRSEQREAIERAQAAQKTALEIQERALKQIQDLQQSQQPKT